MNTIEELSKATTLQERSFCDDKWTDILPSVFRDWSINDVLTCIENESIRIKEEPKTLYVNIYPRQCNCIHMYAYDTHEEAIAEAGENCIKAHPMELPI